METRKAIGTSLAALFLAIGSVFAISPPAHAITVLGGLELGGYCRSIGYNDVVILANNAFAWKCVKGNQRVGINMTAACQWQYNNPNAIASYRDARNQSSWYCFVNSG